MYNKIKSKINLLSINITKQLENLMINKRVYVFFGREVSIRNPWLQHLMINFHE